jgi:hypothetical protein
MTSIPAGAKVMTVEERIAVLEKELTDLKRVVFGKRTEKDWRKTFGTSANDSGFEEMIRLGREIRLREREDKV